MVSYLRSQGFNIFDVLENNLMGADDEQLLELAHSQGRAVLTHDSDFGTLVIAAGKSFTGIIYLKPGHIRTNFTLQSITALVNQVKDVFAPFIIVAQHSLTDVRIRYRQR